MASLGVSGDESSSFVESVRDDKKSSWGVLQIRILAAVRAQAEAEAREAKDAKRSTSRVWNTIQRVLHSMGFLENEKCIALRHESAIKIQRAWKAHVRFETVASNDGVSAFDDSALIPEAEDASVVANNHRSHHVNPLDKVLGKRSALRTFAQMNARTGGKLDPNDIKASGERAPESRFQSQAGKGRESQVGSDMRELSGQRVAIGVILALVFTVVCTYTESNITRSTTMIVLHEQTMHSQFQMDALNAARNTSTTELYMYEPVDGDPIDFPAEGVTDNGANLRDRENFELLLRTKIIGNLLDGLLFERRGCNRPGRSSSPLFSSFLFGSLVSLPLLDPL